MLPAAQAGLPAHQLCIQTSRLLPCHCVPALLLSPLIANRPPAACLQALHSVGIVHRDVKPANIVFDESERRFRLIDLGAAACLRTGTNYKPSETILDPCYCPPEEVREPAGCVAGWVAGWVDAMEGEMG